MKIEQRSITVRDVVAGYKDSGDEGVVAYGGRLNVRPPYQREFVYNDKQRDAVLDTVRKGLPLGVMYWMARAGGYELLDGQQRTLSLCQYANWDFSIDDRSFHNLLPEEQDQILDYPLLVYVCEGTDVERLAWFHIVNIAGVVLTEQELRNAVYTGPWLSAAKADFSKTNGPAYRLANDGGALMKGTPIRQDYLETALSWISDDEPAGYMAQHQHDADAYELWQYFRNVIEWVRRVFPTHRKEMSRVNWGKLYNRFKDERLDPIALEARVVELLRDEDVTRKSGIYSYVLTGNESDLSVRGFGDNVKREAYERAEHRCAQCGETFDLADVEADHITPWSEGGKTTPENCQILCKKHNRTKGRN